MRRRKRAALHLLVAVALSAAAAADAQPGPAPAPANTGTDPNDVAALLALRSSLSNVPSSWMATSDPCGGQPNCEGMVLALNQCAWRGVTCNNSRVTQIELTCMRTVCFNLKGSLPAALANASALQLIDFRGNSIGGTLPPEWGAMSSLMQLTLDWNLIQGTLPSEWSNLKAATYIGLQGNSLGGGLPPSWGNLTSLQLLDLGRNRLGPYFPAEWGTMAALQALNLESNNFEGPLPTSWMGMRSLARLSVRMMCAVCGASPFLHPVDIWMQGSSLTVSCSRTNCMKMPLGFVGQAVIIAAIILVLASLCLVRRCYVVRRARRGGGTMRRGRAANGSQPGDLTADNDLAELPRPPVLVVMPDGQSLCTAREDADWKAAVAAAESCGDASKESGQASVAVTATAAAAGSPTRLRWWERLPTSLGSPARRQDQQVQPSAMVIAQEEAVGIELATTAPESALQLQPAHRTRSRARSSASAASDQGAGEGSSRPGRGSIASSSRPSSDSLQAQAQQQSDLVRPHRLRVSTWRSSREDDDANSAQMPRPSASQQPAVQQAGVAPPAPQTSVGPRPRRPVPIFDIEVPWDASAPAQGDGTGAREARQTG